MRLMLRQFRALAGLTAMECMRQPIFLLLTATCVSATALAPMLLMHRFGEEGRLARDSGLAFHFLFGLLATGYAACMALSRERTNGGGAIVLRKPVGRVMSFLAKFGGVACVALAFSFCAMISTLLAERVAERFLTLPEVSAFAEDTRTGRLLAAAPPAAFLVAGLIQWRYRRPFASTAFLVLALLLVGITAGCGFYDYFGRWAPYDLRLDWRIVPAGLLVTLALLVAGAVALALSTRLAVTPVLAALVGVFLMGLLSDAIFGARAADNALWAGLYRLIPNWQHFWMADALGDGGTISAGYGLRATIYAILYMAGALSLGAAAFRNADLQ